MQLILTRGSWRRVSTIIKRRDRETCQYCGKHDPTGEPDHILPLSQGGSDRFDNLVWACEECNREKQGKTLRQWIKKIRANVVQTKITSLQSPRTPTLGAACKEWLLNLMSERKQIPVREIKQLGYSLGYGWNLIVRTKSELQADGSGCFIVSKRQSTYWVWVLAEEKAVLSTEVAHV